MPSFGIPNFVVFWGADHLKALAGVQAKHFLEWMLRLVAVLGIHVSKSQILKRTLFEHTACSAGELALKALSLSSLDGLERV